MGSKRKHVCFGYLGSKRTRAFLNSWDRKESMPLWTHGVEKKVNFFGTFFWIVGITLLYFQNRKDGQIIFLPCAKLKSYFAAVHQTQKPFRSRARNSKSNFHESFRAYFNCETSSNSTESENCRVPPFVFHICAFDKN